MDKESLKQLIKEEYRAYFTEQQNDPKATLKASASQQIKLLRIMRETLGKITVPPEIDKLAAQVKKAKTTEFLTQVLNVDESIPVRLSSALESPLQLIQAVIDEIINVAINKTREKLSEGIEEAEGDLPDLFNDPLEKYLAKKRKKAKHNPPPPNLDENEAQEYELAKKQLRQLDKQVEKLTYLAGKKRDAGRDNAAKATLAKAHGLRNQASQLRQKHGIPEPMEENEEQE